MINAWPCLTYFSLSVINSFAFVPLIFSFFGLMENGDIHGNMLGKIMQHTRAI